MHRRTFLFAGLAPVLLAASGRSRAAPDETVQWRPQSPPAGAAEIEAKVDRRLREYPRLYAMLQKEAREFEVRARRDVARSRRESPDIDVEHWFFMREYELRTVTQQYVSVTIFHAEFSGGAHPNSVLEALLWDRKRERRVEISELLVDGYDGGPALTALAARVRSLLAAEKEVRGLDVAADPAQDEWIKPVIAHLDALGAVTLTPSTERGKASGLTFTFAPYAVGPYAEGYYTVFVPADELTRFLAPGARALFGGQRPEKDKDFF